MKVVYGFVLLSMLFGVAGGDGNLQHRTKLQARLKLVKIPQFKVDELSVEETFNVLNNQTRQLDAKGEGFNILYKCSKQKKRQSVSLDLAGVPVADVIYFICLQSGLNFRLEEHAVVVWEIRKKERLNKY